MGEISRYNLRKFGELPFHLIRSKNYDDLYSWSIENIANFWGEVWDVTGVKASQPYEKVDAANCFHHAYVQPPR